MFSLRTVLGWIFFCCLNLAWTTRLVVIRRDQPAFYVDLVLLILAGFCLGLWVGQLQNLKKPTKTTPIKNKADSPINPTIYAGSRKDPPRH